MDVLGGASEASETPTEGSGEASGLSDKVALTLTVQAIFVHFVLGTISHRNLHACCQSGVKKQTGQTAPQNPPKTAPNRIRTTDC
jgi:hypothetical protein